MDVKAGLKTHLEISTMQYEVTHCPEGRWGKAEINGQEIDYFEIANYYKKQKGEDPPPGCNLCFMLAFYLFSQISKRA
jgi:hypothetical protein